MDHSHQCALVEKGGKCCESAAMPSTARFVLMPIFGVLVVLGLIAMITLQAKTLRALEHLRKK